MSKSDNNQRSAHTGQLKKDIGQAVHVLQNLTNGLAKIESSLVECDGIRAAERRYNEKVSALQNQITGLQVRCQSAEDQRRQDTTSFATAIKKLTHEYDARAEKKDQERKSELRDIQKRGESKEQALQRELDLQKAEVARLKENENVSRIKVERKMKEADEDCKKQQESQKNKLKGLEEHVLQLSGKNRDLMQELDQHQVMLEGRETEISRLRNRLAALEAFPLVPPDQILSEITRLQSGLHEFCALCVESDSVFPGWRPIPKDLQHQGLPRRYSTQSAAGRYVLTAAIQHSLWMAMAEVVFESYGMQIGQGMVRVADALYRKDPAKEAVWRLLAIDTILEDGELLKILRSHLNAVADRLLESWELFQEGQQRDEFRTGLSALLYDCSTAWLTLLKLRKRLFVSLQWNERRFETDSGEDAAHVPGDFA
ncbi:hypothetical protein MMC13_005916 [Lambiella insularis]|nr:hypothetical protein [Lambiella insularis]